MFDEASLPLRALAALLFIDAGGGGGAGPAPRLLAA